MTLHKSLDRFPANISRLHGNLFLQTVYYCVMFLKILEVMLATVHIDPCYYFSAPHFTFDAFLRHSSLTLECCLISISIFL